MLKRLAYPSILSLFIECIRSNYYRLNTSSSVLEAPQISPVNITAFLRVRFWPGDVRLPCNALLVFCWASKSGPQGEVFRDLQCLRVFFGSDWSAEGHMTADSSSSCLTGCGSGVMSSVPELYGKRCRDLSPQPFPWTGICPRGLRELTSLGICETVTATSSLLLLGLVVEGIQSYVGWQELKPWCISRRAAH